MKKTITILVSIFLIGIFTYLIMANITLKQSIESLEGQFTSEMKLSREQLNRNSENLNLIAGGTNQIRLQNGLPPLNFDYGLEQEEETSIDPELLEEQKRDVFYKALDQLIRVNSEYDLRAQFEAAVLTTAVKKELSSRGYSINYRSTLKGDISSGNEVFLSFMINGLDRFSGIDSYGNEYILTTENDLLSAVDAYLRENAAIRSRTASFKESLSEIPARKDLQQMINEKSIKLKLEQADDRYTLLIRLSDYVVKARAGVVLSKGELYLEDKIYDQWESFEKDLIAYFQALDGRTDREIQDQEVKDFLYSILEDNKFLTYLSDNDLSLSPVIRQSEDSDYIHWDFQNQSGERVGSFALLEGFGELYLLDGDDVVLRSFRNLTENHISLSANSSWTGADIGKIDYIQTSAEEETFLVVGSHERNADTIILVHANSKSNEIDMISIPRDLWYDNRKLNSVYRYYGIDALADTVSELTGLTIDKYMAIDMYAFIDVINIMGGVDVVLEEALVDPTYHIKENGVWTTLNYPAGLQHLDGLGALRVARSRHSTNDYSRSRRQQLIISAIFEKLSTLGISDLDRLVEFVKTGLKYTETNINAGSMIMDILKYKDSNLNSQNVIDATNVLYESYSNLYRLSPQEQEAALDNDDFYLGAWIVLPKDENYNLIKWRIQEIIKE